VSQRSLLIAFGLCCLTAVTLAASQSPDTTPPELVDLDFEPKTINTSFADQTVTLSLRIRDQTGASYIYFKFDQPPGPLQRYGYTSAFQLTSGTPQDGVYTATLTFPRYSLAGTWTIEDIIIRDNADGSLAMYNESGYGPNDLAGLGFPAQLVVVSATPPDTSLPELVDLDFEPKTINTSYADQTVTLSLRIRDQTGASYIYFDFEQPPGPLQRYGSTSAFQLTSGTPQDGVYTATLTFPRYSLAGTWVIEDIIIRDNADGSLAMYNESNYYTNDLAGLGFPTQLVVSEEPIAHTVSAPNTPSGPSSGQAGESLTFSTGGSTCSQGHSVQYRFDWGNGNYSSWSSSTSRSYT